MALMHEDFFTLGGIFTLAGFVVDEFYCNIFQSLSHNNNYKDFQYENTAYFVDNGLVFFQYHTSFLTVLTMRVWMLMLRFPM